MKTNKWRSILNSKGYKNMKNAKNLKIHFLPNDDILNGTIKVIIKRKIISHHIGKIVFNWTTLQTQPVKKAISH